MSAARRLLPAILPLLACSHDSPAEGVTVTHEPPRASSALVATAAAPSSPKARLLAARTVLQVGDSMVGFLGGLQKSLDRRFTERHVHFYSRSWTSASLTSVDTSPELDEALARFHPDLVLLNLGTNNVSWPHPEVLMPRVAAIVKRLTQGGRACVWIGPPSWKQDRGALVPMLQGAVSPCLFFDSRELELERQSDDVHPTDVGGEIWGDAVWRFLESDGEPDGPFLP